MKRAARGLVVLALLLPVQTQAALRDVVINEVAWMGSPSSATDEWIELYNATSSPVDLTGWTLLEGTTAHALSGTLSAGGYLVVERSEAATSVPAGVLASLSLNNAGESLQLVDAFGAVVDTVDASGGWFAGTNTPSKATMERFVARASGSDPGNWHTNDGVTTNGTDSGGLPLDGTPGAANSSGADATPPALIGIHTEDATTLVLWFDESVTAITAQQSSHYTIDGVTHSGPIGFKGTDHSKVILAEVPGLTPGTMHTLTISGVEDASGNALDTTARFLGGPVDMALVQADDASGQATLPPDVYVTVQGWVAATVFSSRETQIYDRTGGVTLYDGAIQAKTAGAVRVRASGRVSTYFGKTEIGEGDGTVDLYVIVSSEAPLLEVDPVWWAADPEAYEGWPVAMRALTRVGGTWPAAGTSENLDFTAADGTAVPVRVDQDTDIDGAAEPTWPETVVGVTSQYDPTTPYLEGHQLLPRGLSDFGVSLCDCAPETVAVQWCFPASGTCEVVACALGRGNCDGEGDNGCERDLRTDLAHCGVCGRACDAGETCVGGSCVPPTCPDADRDGYAAASCGGGDCDDGSAAVHPGATEIWYDGRDQNCDAANDYDRDQDGFVAADYPSQAGGTAPWTGDCDDGDAAVHPEAKDVCGNGVDEDCSGGDLACAVDGGPATDAGPEVDGGPAPDGGPEVDGGPVPDGGPIVDGGPAVDGGPEFDGGPAVDGGPAGTDGGFVDAGHDSDADYRGFGCGCSASAGSAGWGAWLLFGALALGWRRRR